MRRHLLVVLILASFVGVSASSFGQEEAKADLEAQVQALVQEVATLRGELEESSVRIDEMVGYLKQNQKAAEELSSALAASEAAGFTFGINPKSRQILLTGWRKQLSTMQKGVPGAAAEEATAKQTRGSIRQPKRW